jgi:hypothetical protein
MSTGAAAFLTSQAFKLSLVAGGTAALISSYFHYYSAEAQLGRLLVSFTENLRAEQQLARIKPLTFTIDRTLDGDCLGKRLAVGVHTVADPDKPLSNQGIRLGDDGPIRRLLSMEKNDSPLTDRSKKLAYTFEDDTHLTIQKFKDDRGLQLYYKDPERSVLKKVDTWTLSLFKPISMNSAELDAIEQMK